jgi:glucan 1,3-beta-glucosidase
MSGTTLTTRVLNRAYKPPANSAASATLRDSTGWLARSKPQYESLAIGSLLDVKHSGAKGDGMSDDTAAINAALASAAGKTVVYFPHGSYIVTDTINVPPGTKMVGEAWCEIMGMGNKFADITKPTVMVRVGTAGQTGRSLTCSSQVMFSDV